MKTSARNHFPGTVRAIRAGAVNDEIDIEIAGGQRIVATITSASSAALALKVGSAAHALIKASSVILVTEPQGFKFSARNQLTGPVARIATGAINSDVVIDLPGGVAVSAVVTNDSVAALGLKVGQTATAMFKVSNVIVAVQG